MKKNTTRVLLIILMILALILGMILDAFMIAPSYFTTRYETLGSSLIGDQMDGVNILFFSDLNYGTFMDQTRLNKLIQHINNIAPDVIVFGGDIYDQNISADDASNQILINALSSLQAPLGKFAVYGDHDDASEDMKNAVNNIYANSGFEVLNNKSIAIHNTGYQSVFLVGIDNKLNGSPDIAAAYSSVARDSYVITVCHTPDSADDVPADLTGYFLAGHSLGGQVYYFFSALYTPSMAEKHFRGKSLINNSFTLDITNGTGTTGKDIRLFADAEVVLYTLKHT